MGGWVGDWGFVNRHHICYLCRLNHASELSAFCDVEARAEGLVYVFHTKSSLDSNFLSNFECAVSYELSDP